jgi:hypothetical protein
MGSPFKRTVCITFTVIAILVLTFAMAGCEIKSEVQRKASIFQRAEMFARAETMYPVPNTNNFPMRRDLVKYTQRQDIISHPWYVYVLGDTGNYIGYYVASGQPVSTNAFLSSTEDWTGSAVLTAPSLDGVYYGGAGGSAGNGWFFFDAATDALIILYDVKLFVSDVPLKLDVKPILVASQMK